MRVVLAFCFLLVGCSDSTSNPGPGGSNYDGGYQDASKVDGTVAGKGTPTNCTPDKYFCHGTEIRHCTASGKDSVFRSDCASSNIAGVKYACITCPSSGTGITCEADKPLITGSASGIVSFSYSFRPTCNPTSSASIYVSSAFSHSVSPNKGATYPNLSISASGIAKIPSGKAVPILFPASGIVVSLSKSKTTSCVNYGTNAPSLGTITVNHQGATKGSTVTVKLNGKLTCDGGKTWEAFTYNATGINP